MLCLLLDVSGATFQIASSALLLLLAQLIELLIAVSRAMPNVAQVGDKQRVRIAYNKPCFPQAKNTLASCLAIW
jgi:hypothetical protein